MISTKATKALRRAGQQTMRCNSLRNFGIPLSQNMKQQTSQNLMGFLRPENVANHNGVVSDIEKYKKFNMMEMLRDITNNIGMTKPEPEMKAVFLIGGPASGKGTYAAKMIETMDVSHVSIGDLLRQEVQSKTGLGLEVADKMKKGLLVSTEVVMSILANFLEDHKGRTVLIDGFPRAMEHLDSFEKMVGKPHMAIVFDCPDEELTRRIVKRGAESGRSDDNLETAKQRIEIYRRNSGPLIERLQSEKTNVVTIDSEQPIDFNMAKLKALPLFVEEQPQTEANQQLELQLAL